MSPKQTPAATIALLHLRDLRLQGVLRVAVPGVGGLGPGGSWYLFTEYNNTYNQMLTSGLQVQFSLAYKYNEPPSTAPPTSQPNLCGACKVYLLVR